MTVFFSFSMDRCRSVVVVVEGTEGKKSQVKKRTTLVLVLVLALVPVLVLVLVLVPVPVLILTAWVCIEQVCVPPLCRLFRPL